MRKYDVADETQPPVEKKTAVIRFMTRTSEEYDVADEEMMRIRLQRVRIEKMLSMNFSV